MNKKLITLIVAGVAGIAPSTAGTFSLSGPFTDDASTGISTANTYTHAISGGSARTVNGVDFEQLSPDVVPANFSWDAGGLNKNQVVNNFGDWTEANGRSVTGPEILGLLQDFTYSGNGANQPSAQTFVVSGLTAGTNYDMRLYVRPWDTEGSGRAIAFTYTNGAEVDEISGLEDRPGTVLGTGDELSAYYLNYAFTAQTDSVTINAAVGSDVTNSGSFHMYALSNQVVPEPGSALLLCIGGTLLAGLRRRR